MKQEIDPFDTSAVTDLPEEIKKQLRGVPVKGLRPDTAKVLALFDKRPILAIDEIVVALYRIHQMQKSRSWVFSTLSNLQQKKFLKRVDGEVGKWEKVNSPLNPKYKQREVINHE